MLSRKRVLSTLVHSWFALAILACGNPERGNARAASNAARTFRVGLLTTGPVADQAWNAGAYRGLQAIRDSLGARISNVETPTPADIEENFRQYGSQRYDVVFGHGFEYQDPALRAAPAFPNTTYVITSGSKAAKNVASIEFAFSDGAYLAGIVAGANTHSNIVGVLGGTELPPVVQAFKAFEAGAQSVNPKVRVLTSYVGNWEDASAAREQALAQIGRGADMIFQDADAAGLGVFQAARDSKNVRVFGSNSDQNAIAPQVTLGSVLIDLPRAFLLVAREVKNGTFRPGIIRLGERDSVVRWVPNPVLAHEISPMTVARIDSVQKQIDAGKLTVTR